MGNRTALWGETEAVWSSALAQIIEANVTRFMRFNLSGRPFPSSSLEMVGPFRYRLERRDCGSLCRLVPNTILLSRVELRDVAAGLWIWRHEHPRWKPGQGWEAVVASTGVEAGGGTPGLDSPAPPPHAAQVCERLSARSPAR